MTVRECKRTAALCLCVLLACLTWGCGTSSSSTTAVQSTRQLHEYRDFDALCNAIGFTMMQIAGGGFEPQSYSSIDDEIGQIIYKKDDMELILRMSEGTDDISGVGNVAYTSRDMYGNEIQLGSFADIQVARFIIGDYDYALSATGVSAQDFDNLISEFVNGLVPR